LYRGSYKDGLRIGTIKHINDTTILITGAQEAPGWMLPEALKSYQPQEEWTYHIPCFEWENNTMCWSGREGLIDSLGLNLATFAGAPWGWHKVGELEISDWVSEDTRKTNFVDNGGNAAKAAVERARIAAEACAVAEVVGDTATKILTEERKRQEERLKHERDLERENERQRERERHWEESGERDKGMGEREGERERGREGGWKVLWAAR
jgi:hypothetical protein